MGFILQLINVVVKIRQIMLEHVKLTYSKLILFEKSKKTITSNFAHTYFLPVCLLVGTFADITVEQH